MSMNTPIGNITQTTTPIKDFKELDEMQNEQYLLGIDDNAVGNGSKISLENLINSSISTDSDNLITKGTDDRLLVNTPVEIGDLSNLTTTNKSTLVAAINEVDSDIATEVTNRVNAVSGEATTRANADNNLQSQIDAITAASDVTDIVGTYAQLQAYDTTGLADKSVIKVLQDESRQNETTYYRWVITGGVGAWVLIGEEGPFYTISQADNKFATQETVGNLSNLATSDKSSVVNAMNELASVLDPTQTADYIKNSKAIYSGEVSENALILPQIKEMAHSTFARSKFTVVGSPTITDDGIASGFSRENDLITNYIFNPNGTWEIKGVFTISTTSTTDQVICSVSDITYKSRIVIRPNLRLGWYLSSNNSSYDINQQEGTQTLELNTKYYFEWSFDGAQYLLKVSTDGVNWQTSAIIASSAKIYTTANTKIRIGKSIDQYGIFTGSIDLKGVNITANGVEVFSGNKTGIDTIKADDYQVVGAPTISADGIASGFSSSNYLYTSILPNGNNIHITEKITAKNINNPAIQVFLYAFKSTDNTQRLFDIRWDGTRLKVVYSDTNNSTIQAWGNLYPQENADYLFDIYINNGTLTIFANGTQVFIASNLYEDGIGYATLGSTGSSFEGSIDLNAFKVYVDGDLVYQPLLRIPYTESKTGSKVVDSYYRNRVNDMATQFGYAPYYTLSDTDFTLPQVELYGLFEKYKKSIENQRIIYEANWDDYAANTKYTFDLSAEKIANIDVTHWNVEVWAKIKTTAVAGFSAGSVFLLSSQNQYGGDSQLELGVGIVIENKVLTLITGNSVAMRSSIPNIITYAAVYNNIQLKIVIKATEEN